MSLGIGRQGGFGGNSSGDIFIAFSTANARAWFDDQPVTDVKMLPNDRITPLFQATAQATEAAITNALLAAETMTGANDLRVYAHAGRSDARGDEEVRPAAVVCARTLAPGIAFPADCHARTISSRTGDAACAARRAVSRRAPSSPA